MDQALPPLRETKLVPSIPQVLPPMASELGGGGSEGGAWPQREASLPRRCVGPPSRDEMGGWERAKPQGRGNVKGRGQVTTLEQISCRLVAIFLAGASHRKTWHFSI